MIPNEEAETPSLPMSDAMYTRLKFVALVLLPALSTLYFALGGIWGLPAVTQVIGTLAAIDTFLGVVLKVSTKRYDASDAKYDGRMVMMDKPEGGKLYSLELNGDPLDMSEKSVVMFKVESQV